MDQATSMCVASKLSSQNNDVLFCTTALVLLHTWSNDADHTRRDVVRFKMCIPVFSIRCVGKVVHCTLQGYNIYQ